MYVNISHCDIICDYCQHLNFSKETAKQLLAQLKKIGFDNEETREIKFIILCDHCKKRFQISLTVSRYKLVYFLE